MAHKEKNLQTLSFAAVAIAAALLMLSFGCAAQATDAPAQPAGASAQPAATGSSAHMSPAASGVSGNSSNQAQASQGTGTRLTLIKFRGSSQCVSCINLGKFANSTLERNFQKELVEGKVKYLDINAETDPTDPYVQKYRPTYTSIFLLTEGAGGEKYEELSEAWYYTGDEAKYQQYLTGLLRKRLSGVSAEKPAGCCGGTGGDLPDGYRCKTCGFGWSNAQPGRKTVCPECGGSKVEETKKKQGKE